VISSYLDTTDAAAYASVISAEMQPGTLTDGVAAEAAWQVFDYLNAIGFVDGPSPTGATYDFGVVNYWGTDGADRLAASTYGSSHLYGYGGNDTLIGSKDGISSILEGGAGDDNYTIYQSIDVVLEQPGGGSDTVYTYANYTLPDNVEIMFAMAGGLTLHSNAVGGRLVAAAGGDTLIGGGGADTLQGGSGNDVLIAGSGSGNAKLLGNDGDDQLQVFTGNNTLLGGTGNDTLIAGAGNDTLEGDAGADVMRSGGGATTFLYRAPDFAAGLAASEDTIYGFNHAKGDIINLAGVDANANTPATDTFKWIGTAQFDGAPGELRYQADGDGITIYGDTTGSGVANMAIHLSGVITIASNSFVL
jgi:Ca2+-binding RTX toxin-like protein